MGATTASKITSRRQDLALAALLVSELTLPAPMPAWSETRPGWLTHTGPVA